MCVFLYRLKPSFNIFSESTNLHPQIFSKSGQIFASVLVVPDFVRLEADYVYYIAIYFVFL